MNNFPVSLEHNLKDKDFMEAAVRNRKIRIVNRGLRLLQSCKVPRFSPTDSAGLGDLQHAWSGQLVPSLTRLVQFLERHRKMLFEQDWGPVSGEFRKRFVLIFFEHMCTNNYERAAYQPEEDNVYDLELRFASFTKEVECIFTKASNSALRSWLFHHYGCVLGTEGWQNHPGELYSFVRLSCFLLDRERKENVQLGSRVLSFAETFGTRLLGDRHNRNYQTLGIRLMNAVMRYTCRKHGYTENAQEILELALRLVRKQLEETEDDLFNIIYCSVRSVRVPDRSLDDEVMRTLVSHLSEEDTSVGTDAACLRALIRILLLDVPGVEMDELNCEKFTIDGRVCDGDKFRSHLRNLFRCNAVSSDGRISIRWKFRIGLLIPKLLGRVITSSTFLYFIERSYVQGLAVLAWLVLFPIGQTWRQKSARSAMFCGMLDELFNGLSELLRTLQNQRRTRNRAYNDILLQTQQALHRDYLALFFTIMEGMNALVNECLQLKLPWPNRHLLRIRTMVDNLELRKTAVHRVIQQVLDALIRLVNIQ